MSRRPTGIYSLRSDLIDAEGGLPMHVINGHKYVEARNIQLGRWSTRGVTRDGVCNMHEQSCRSKHREQACELHAL
ncbi:uncharacterized protein LOC124704445 isoform X2 [Lolium rigidum]|uniref:uncharacterized protein LOC124704445 isoform X2 n=1 Tax=Lolium rigidum TaxID=89674 RepID=UPI001F5C82DE|nr:uncharacterized protein LOC124704445 isoform X2 [Lolium rigidum]